MRAESFSQIIPNRLGRVLSGLWSGHHSGADGPYRLIRHNQTRRFLVGKIACDVMHLPHGEIKLNAFATFLVAFADAKNRLHFGRQNSAYLIHDVRIIFRMVLSSFGMSDNHIRTAEVGDHIGRHISSERALRCYGNSLCAVVNLQIVGFDQHLHAA